MNNYLIKKEKLSVFEKILIILKKRIFGKNYYEEIITKEVEETKLKRNAVFEEGLKVEISDKLKRENELKEFIKQIELDTDLIEMLSDDRLDRLINYYEQSTNAKRIKIAKLKKLV